MISEPSDLSANLDRVREEFARNFTQRGELGASVSVWQHGHEILNRAGGFQDREQTTAWTAETPVLFWSATKGLASACVLHACQEAGVSLDRRVTDFWPEFGAAGKAEITIARLMAHRAGLAALSSSASVLDYSAVIAALEQEPPRWDPATHHGYHPRTFGFLLDELLRRITGGTTLREYWQATFAQPLALDLWIGVPESELDRVACVFPAKNAPPKGDPFYVAFLSAGSITARSFASPKGLHSAAAMNSPNVHTASLPGFGGIGTASSLAKFYSLLASGGELEDHRWFTPETLAHMSTTLVQGPDQVLLMETAFSAGYMKDPVAEDSAGPRKIRSIFGPSLTAFGQPGAGGSNAFADPEHGISFAYVMNQMEPGVLPGPKSLRLIDALYGIADAR